MLLIPLPIRTTIRLILVNDNRIKYFITKPKQIIATILWEIIIVVKLIKFSELKRLWTKITVILIIDEPSEQSPKLIIIIIIIIAMVLTKLSLVWHQEKKLD